MRQFKFLLTLLIASSHLASPSWAGDAVLAARYYEDALKRYEQQDHAGAIVQLKNALQQDPNYLSAYILLGQAQLRKGDASGAELSLLTALRMGADQAELADPLSEALMGQGKYKELLERVKPAGLPPDTAQKLFLTRAYAQMALADYAAAKREIDQAALQDGDTGGIAIARGMLNLQQGKITDARQFADQAIQKVPDDPYAWNLKASVDHARGDAKSALAGYERALALRPDFVDVRVARAGLLFDLNRPEAAYKDLSYLKEKLPEEPRAAYLRSIYHSQKGDAAAAKVEMQLAAKSISTLPPAYLNGKPQLLMAGALANHGLGAYEQALGYAESYVRLKPDDPGARKLLAAIQLAQGGNDAAITNLLRAYRASPRDPGILNMLASAYIHQNQYAKAANLLEQAGAMTLQKPQLASTLGLSLIGLGREAQGMEYLSQAFAKNPGDFRLGNSLVMLNLQQGHGRTAVRVAEALLAKHGKSPAAHNLLGVAKAGTGDVAGARSAYERALSLAPRLEAARLNLAKLETAQGNYDAARRQLQVILKARPKHAQAQYELGLTELAAGRSAEALRWLQAAHLQSPRNAVIAVRLVNTYLALGQAEKALAVAKQSAATTPDNFDVTSALGRAHAALGQTSRARATFANMSKLAGFDVAQLEQTARLQLAVDDLNGAVLSLGKALGDEPGAIEANLLMAEVERRRGQAAQGLERARRIAAANPRSSRAQRGLGDMLMAHRQFTPAAQAYRTALDIDDHGEHALLYQGALRAGGNVQQAIAFLEEWTRRHSQAGEARIALAESYLDAGQPAKARSAYEGYLKQHGDHPAVLNNLANILMRQGDPGAQPLAERAYKLAPNAAPVNDTLGWLLLQKGETDRALRHLREARARAPEEPVIHYHLAAALHRAGRSSEAIRELELALKSNVSFDGVEDARQLLQRLKQR